MCPIIQVRLQGHGTMRSQVECFRKLGGELQILNGHGFLLLSHKWLSPFNPTQLSNEPKSISLPPVWLTLADLAVLFTFACKNTLILSKLSLEKLTWLYARDYSNSMPAAAMAMPRLMSYVRYLLDIKVTPAKTMYYNLNIFLFTMFPGIAWWK